MAHSQPTALQQTVCKFHLDPQYHIFHWGSTILRDSTLWRPMEYTHRCVVFALTSRVGCRNNTVNVTYGVIVVSIMSDLPTAGVITVLFVILWRIEPHYNSYRSSSIDSFSTSIGFIPFPRADIRIASNNILSPTFYIWRVFAKSGGFDSANCNFQSTPIGNHLKTNNGTWATHLYRIWLFY